MRISKIQFTICMHIRYSILLQDNSICYSCWGRLWWFTRFSSFCTSEDFCGKLFKKFTFKRTLRCSSFTHRMLSVCNKWSSLLEKGSSKSNRGFFCRYNSIAESESKHPRSDCSRFLYGCRNTLITGLAIFIIIRNSK